MILTLWITLQCGSLTSYVFTFETGFPETTKHALTSEHERREMVQVETFVSVRDVLADTTEQAVSLIIRAELMNKVA